MSVIRSSNHKTTKAAVKPSSTPSSFTPMRHTRNHSATQPILSTTTDRVANPVMHTSPPSLSNASVDRSALHQALYPRHAHLFGPQTNNSSFEWDLSPSVFTRTSDVTGSQQPDVARELHAEDTQSVFARGSELHKDVTSRGGNDFIPKPSILTYGSSMYTPSSAASPSTSAPVAASTNAGWVPYATATETAAAATSQGSDQDASAYQVDYEPYLAPNSLPPSQQPMILSREWPEPPRTLQSFADPMSNHPPNAASYLTATGYVTSMLEDTSMSRETLAMWSNVPPGFKYVQHRFVSTVCYSLSYALPIAGTIGAHTSTV